MSCEINITVTGLDEAIDYFDRAASTLVENVSLKLSDVCQDIVAYARATAPVRTGEYQASIGMQQTGPLTFSIFADAAHAAFVEFGTAPHIITPKNVKALHFDVEGEEVFALYVLHPGTAPQMIIHNAKKANMAAIVDAIRSGVAEALSEGGGK